MFVIAVTKACYLLLSWATYIEPRTSKYFCKIHTNSIQSVSLRYCGFIVSLMRARCLTFPFHPDLVTIFIYSDKDKQRTISLCIFIISWNVHCTDTSRLKVTINFRKVRHNPSSDQVRTDYTYGQLYKCKQGISVEIQTQKHWDPFGRSMTDSLPLLQPNSILPPLSIAVL